MSPRTTLDLNPDEPCTCDACGWTGPAREAVELFEQLLTLNCPRCDKRVGGMYLYPTHEEIRAAAAAGNPQAIKELANVEQRERRWQQADRHELRRPEQLADVPGEEPFLVRWSLEHSDDEEWVVLRVDEHVIGRELAVWEGLPRFRSIAELLVQRYPRRVLELRPDKGEAETYLLGDKLSWINGIEEVNQEVIGRGGAEG